MLTNQYNFTHHIAAKKIQIFYQAIKQYHALIQACLVNNNILTLRQREMAEVFSNIAPSDIKNMAFLQAIRGIKMVASFNAAFVAHNTNSQHPIPAINLAYSPTYMRDRDVQVRNFVENMLVDQFKEQKIHIVFNHQYIVMLLKKKLQSLTTSYFVNEQIIAEKNAIIKYLKYLEFMHNLEIAFIEENEEIINYIQPILKLTGIKPSYYKIIATLNAAGNLPPINSTAPLSFTTGLPLNVLLTTADYIATHLKLTNHLVINIAIHLIKGLTIFQSEANALDNLFNQQCFHMLNCCLNLMYVYRDSNYLLNYLYDTLIEELAALLIYNGNPSQKPYAKILKELYYARLPIIQDKQWSLHNFLTSNGMEAISLAIINQENCEEISLMLQAGTYFEVEQLKEQLGINTYAMSNYIFFVTLEPSTYTSQNFSTEEFSKKIENFLAYDDYTDNKFITIIIDVSIESAMDGQNKLQKFLATLADHITQGKINIILVKSLQKYALLGTAKYMAGNIAIINNGQPKFNLITTSIQQYTASIGLEKNKEYPFITFFLEYAGQFELLATNKAIENANFLRALFKDHIQWKKNPIQQLANSPFIFFVPNNELIALLKNKEDLIPTVDSFGFLHTTLLKVFNSIRLNPGWETKEYLTEIFFQFSSYSNQHLNSIMQIILGKELLHKITNEFAEDSISTIEKIVAIIKNNTIYKKDLFKYLSNMFTRHNEDYMNNKIYSLLYGKHSVVNHYFTTELLAEIIPEILNTNMLGLSLVAKKNLRKLHVKNCLLKICNLVEIDSYTSFESLANIQFNAYLTQQFTLFKQTAHKLFYAEDLLIFLLNILWSKKSMKNVIIFNEIFKEYNLSLLMLFNIAKNFIKPNYITPISLFLLYKLLDPELYNSTSIPLEYKNHILNHIKKIVDKIPVNQYPEMHAINQRMDELPGLSTQKVNHSIIKFKI